MAGIFGGYDIPDWMVFGGEEQNRPNAMLGGSPVQGVPNPMFGDRWQPVYDAVQPGGGWYSSDASYPTTESLAPRPGFPSQTPSPQPPMYPGANQYAGQSPAMGYAGPPRQQQSPQGLPPQIAAPGGGGMGLPQASGWDRLGQGINDNALTLMALGGGIMQGGLGKGLQMAAPAAMADRKQKNEASAQQAALQMVAGDTELSPAMKQAIMRSPELAQRYAENKIKTVGGTTDDLREFATWQKHGGGKDLSPGTNLFDHYMTKVKQRETENFALTVTPELQPDGTVRHFQLGNRGSKKYLDTGEGKIAVKAREVKTDTGTHLIDPHTNQILKTIDKNVQEGAAAREKGQKMGTVEATLPNVEANAARLLTAVSEAKIHPGLKQAVGQYKGSPIGQAVGPYVPNVGPDIKDFQERITQIGSQTWTDGIKDMVNLGALSNAEGSRIEAARARLSLQKEPKDLLIALNDIEELTKEGLRSAQLIAAGKMRPKNEGQQAPAAAPAAASEAAAPAVKEGATATNPQTGEKLIFRNGKWVKQ